MSILGCGYFARNESFLMHNGSVVLRVVATIVKFSNHGILITYIKV